MQYHKRKLRSNTGHEEATHFLKTDAGKEKSYYAALYMRLSKDDDRAGESASITTQKKMLRAFAKENGFFVYGEYIDDGYSGTNFNRPDFIRMLSDIEAKRVNLVITKDLSRLGRDYISAGQYTEIYFPEHGVRYIAINDGYDSISPYNDIAPFKNIINEMYARDISKKIRSAITTKMKEGNFIGSFAPYGYQKDPEDKNHLLVDPAAAPVVQKMFELAGENLPPGKIAQFFNEQGVAPPSLYRCMANSQLDPNGYSKRKEWTSSGICKMLKNMVYLGHSAQGKTSKVSFKSRTTLSKPPEDWYIVKNTHEPIVTQDVYDRAQRRCAARRAPPNRGFQNIFSGIAKCMDCKKNMSTSSGKGGTSYLVCGRYKLYGKKECTNHLIDYGTLYDIVLRDIKKQIILDETKKRAVLSSLCCLLEEKEQYKARTKNTAAQKKRFKELDKIMQKLYEDNLCGKITDKRFSRMLKAYEEEQERLAAELERLSADKVSVANSELYQICAKELDEISQLKTLTPVLLRTLIDRIEIGQGSYQESNTKAAQKKQLIRIYYRFSDIDSDEAGSTTA